MIVARVIQGVGGGVLPLSFGIIRDEFPKEKVVGAVGVIAALAAAGAGLGIVLAGPIVDALNYHWLFWIPMIVMALGAVAAHCVVPESPVRIPGLISWAGVPCCRRGWSRCCSHQRGADVGLGVGGVIGLLVVAVVLAVVWVIVESPLRQPLIDMQMMRIPGRVDDEPGGTAARRRDVRVFAFLPEFLQTPPSAGYGFGVSITKSGLILLPMSVIMFVFGMLSGRLSKRFGGKSVLVAGSLIGIVAVRAPHVRPQRTSGRSCSRWSLLGVGFGLAFAAMSNLVVVGRAPEQTGVASGMNANIRTIGGSIGAAVMSSIVTAGASARRSARDSPATPTGSRCYARADRRRGRGHLRAGQARALPSRDELHDACRTPSSALIAAGHPRRR